MLVCCGVLLLSLLLTLLLQLGHRAVAALLHGDTAVDIGVQPVLQQPELQIAVEGQQFFPIQYLVGADLSVRDVRRRFVPVAQHCLSAGTQLTGHLGDVRLMRMLLKIPDDVDHVLARRVLRHRHEVKVQVRLSALILVYLGGHHISLSVVSYSDTNYDDAQVNITLTGAMRKGVALDGSYADQHNGKVFTFKNFAKEKEVDDIYTLAATLTDKAGNTTEKTILFSANRFGSTYALSAATDQLNGSYVQTPQDVVVTETNPDALQNIRITLFKNNQTIILQEGTDYRIEVRGGNGQWYEYIYTVLAKNFADDGVYRLTFYSEDAAGNIAENTLDTKKQEIGFGVDKTKPNMVVTNLESDTTYPLENLTVSLSAGDNLLLQSVVVYLDDYSKAYKTWTAEEVAAIVADQGEFTFDIPGDSTGAHQVKIVCTDAAGNEQTEEITNFYVTTNLFVRYYNNKPLFFGSIAAVVVIAGVVIALAAGKKKKNDKEK